MKARMFRFKVLEDEVNVRREIFRPDSPTQLPVCEFPVDRSVLSTATLHRECVVDVRASLVCLQHCRVPRRKARHAADAPFQLYLSKQPASSSALPRVQARAPPNQPIDDTALTPGSVTLPALHND